MAISWRVGRNGGRLRQEPDSTGRLVEQRVMAGKFTKAILSGGFDESTDFDL
jgi:hypothetical protein